jgi:flagellar basal-body rod protein FlgG
MIAQQRRHDTVTNNLANIYTPGYKQNFAPARAFPEMLISRINGGEPRVLPIGRLNTGVMVEEVLGPVVQGELLETRNPGDFAIVSNIRVFEEIGGEQVEIVFDLSGKGVNQNGETVYQPQAFFTLLTPDGERRYTRNGKFYVNEEGFLVNENGLSVLNRNGQAIQLNDPDFGVLGLDDIQVAPNGQLLYARTGDPITDAAGEPVFLLISRIDNPNRLIREGGSLYRLENPQEQPPAVADNLEEVVVYQGYIERSNVDPVQSVVDMMTAARLYEANQKVIQFYDRSMDKAVNEVGRV